MKTHLIACAVLLASCAAPRAERREATLDEPPEELRAEGRDEPAADGDAPAASRTGGTCTRDDPCTLEVVEIARRRVDLENENEAKIAQGKENAQTRRVAESWIQKLGRSIADERERFSQWCEKAQGWSAEKRKTGSLGLTPDDVYRWTGRPTQEMTPDSRGDDSVEAKAWAWEVSGPISRSVSFAVLFLRPAGTKGSWVFSGCQWCASGGPATTKGCVTLPESRPREPESPEAR